MQKVWSIIRKSHLWPLVIFRLWPNRALGIRMPLMNSGFSVVEVLLAATVFGFLVTALSGALIYGRSGTAIAGERLQALTLAEEGLEAVRNIRDASYSNLSDGTYGVTPSGSPLVWNFSGTSDNTGVFTRQITVATVDSTRKAITSTVSWTNNGISRQVTATSRLTNWRAAFSVPTPGPIMMAYSKTTTTPFYRIWNGSAWGAEGSAQAVVGNINYVVLKSARTRNEAILGVQTSTGAIYIQIWNGTSWGNLTQVGTGNTTTRSFDIDYEKNGDRAIIAYIPTASSIDFDYRIWNGTALSGVTTVTTSPTTGAINWIELDNSPLTSSNDIAMIMQDASSAVYGMVWNGTTWGNMGVPTTWDASGSTATRKGIDVAYEQNSGDALFVWGDSLSTANAYRTWNGTSTTTGALTVSTQGGVTNWLQLASRPSSDEIMVGIQDAGSDLNTRRWTGSAWDAAHGEHSSAVENAASRNFDIVWETHSSNLGDAWILWGNGTAVTAKQWTSNAWVGTGTALSGSDDTSFIRLRADPVSGAVFAGIYQNSTSTSRDINERRLTGGGSTWTTKSTIWAGPTGADPVFFRVDIATP